MHTPNLALIVGHYDTNIREPIKTAAGIIKANLEEGKNNKGMVLLSSAVYVDPAEKIRAKERTLFMNRLSQEIIQKNYPEMLSQMHSMAVVLNASTMEMEIIQ